MMTLTWVVTSPGVHLHPGEGLVTQHRPDHLPGPGPAPGRLQGATPGQEPHQRVSDVPGQGAARQPGPQPAREEVHGPGHRDLALPHRGRALADQEAHEAGLGQPRQGPRPRSGHPPRVRAAREAAARSHVSKYEPSTLTLHLIKNVAFLNFV